MLRDWSMLLRWCSFVCVVECVDRGGSADDRAMELEDAERQRRIAEAQDREVRPSVR